VRQIFFLCLFILTFASRSEAQINFNLSGYQAIYGRDDRELVTKNSDVKIQEAARGVALIVSKDVVKRSLLKTQVIGATLEKNLNLCTGEKFSEHLSQSGCTGFLIASDVMLSAGHCFESSDDCANKKIIFDVTSQTETLKGFDVDNKNIFSCKKIIQQAANSSQDYAIIQLDRAPGNRSFLKLHTAEKTADDSTVFMLGHPFGLPLMYSKAAAIIDNNDPFIFKTALDSFEGNSGSPVINAKTFEVEGILVNGQQDLVQDPQLGCYRNKTYDESTGGEGAFRVSELPSF
jgi:hypothetical protein